MKPQLRNEELYSSTREGDNHQHKQPRTKVEPINQFELSTHFLASTNLSQSLGITRCLFYMFSDGSLSLCLSLDTSALIIYTFL